MTTKDAAGAAALRCAAQELDARGRALVEAGSRVHHDELAADLRALGDAFVAIADVIARTVGVVVEADGDDDQHVDGSRLAKLVEALPRPRRLR